MSCASDSSSALLRLIEACRADDPGAWTALLHDYQPRLTRTVSGWLGRQALVDEIVAEVLSQLWEKRLLDAFDPGRGSLQALLEAMARQRLCARQRGFPREPGPLPASGQPTDYRLDPQALAAHIEEFRAGLSPGLQARLDRLVRREGAGPSEQRVSAANAWQMDHRLRERWNAFEAGHPPEKKDFAPNVRRRGRRA